VVSTLRSLELKTSLWGKPQLVASSLAVPQQLLNRTTRTTVEQPPRCIWRMKMTISRANYRRKMISVWVF
jgi:hypothetical protein